MPKKKIKITSVPPEDAAISHYLMQKNLDKNFVQRAYNPIQSIQVPGVKGRSTHLMAYDPGSQRVYPEVVQQNGQLKYLQGDDAWNYADSTGEYIQMPPSEKVMKMFSDYGYKQASNVPIQKYGGNMAKIRIVGLPKMEAGGWATQVGSKYRKQLSTPWPLSVYQQPVPDPQYGMKDTLKPVPREFSDIEAEQGETIIGDFDGDGAPENMKVGGKRHYEGGTPLQVPDGAFVYSDTQKLKIKAPNILAMFGGGKAKTPAKIANQYKLNDYKALIDNPDTDPMTRKTAQMMYANNTKKLSQLAQVQEMIKESKGILSSPQQPMMKYGGGNKTANIDGTIDHTETPKRRIVITGAPEYMRPETTIKAGKNVYGMRFDQNPTQQSVPVPDIPGVSPTPANMQQGITQDTLGSLTPSPTSVQPTGIYQPQMRDVQPYVPVIPKGTTKMNKALTGLKDAAGTYRGLSADALGDIALGLRAATNRKFMPWEPPVQVVYPEFVPESDQPIRNTLSEATNTMQQGMYSGNSRIGRAAALAGQGQLLAQAAQAVGQVSNRNAQAANQYSSQIAGITNEKLAQDRARAKRLYDGSVISSQEYINSMNNINDMIAARAAAHEQKASELAWTNKTSPYFAADKRGVPVFKSAEAKARFENEVINMRGGENTGGGGTYEDWYDYYTNVKKVPAEAAKEMAAQTVKDTTKQPRITKSLSKKTPTGTEKTTIKKYGGFLSFLK